MLLQISKDLLLLLQLSGGKFVLFGIAFCCLDGILSLPDSLSLQLDLFLNFFFLRFCGGQLPFCSTQNFKGAAAVRGTLGKMFLDISGSFFYFRKAFLGFRKSRRRERSAD